MDRISGLSDELLIKILSLLPTKLAVSTSILSKRWEHLWLWLPKLDYDSRYYSESEWSRLQRFLDRNLPLHKAPVLESFRLDLSRSHIDPVNIKMWVGIAAFHGVRSLKIVNDSYPEEPNILPSNLYTCKSLVILKLKGDILLDVPRMVFLPSLKTLRLRSVRYCNEESIRRLLSNCPILEDVSVKLREVDVMGKLTIVVPSLQRLSLLVPSEDNINGIAIETPSLKYLKLECYKTENYYCLIENMPNLIEAYLEVQLPNIKSLIGSITCAKRLTICSECVYDEGFVFNQLEHLEVCSCKEHSWGLLVRLLKDSPNLQVLKLSEFERLGV